MCPRIAQSSYISSGLTSTKVTVRLQPTRRVPSKIFSIALTDRATPPRSTLVVRPTSPGPRPLVARHGHWPRCHLASRGCLAPRVRALHPPLARAWLRVQFDASALAPRALWPLARPMKAPSLMLPCQAVVPSCMRSLTQHASVCARIARNLVIALTQR